jgi:DNA polymerase-3 subunit alpha|nr:MAG TPA: DNA polymerase III, alpha subunit [Caudoviricetes sp.]DAL15142.1 MAG TPA_asm: DNA polymerase III, alpha subunit [Caudoviricetes sp.]
MVNNKLFLNPERVSMPDLDIDVSDRPTVINYLIDKYGENRVCQIINFSYITPVVAIKDVGKILGFKYNEMDKLSKKFSYNTFQECIDNNINYLSEHPEYSELLDIAGKLSGRVKTVSCHAGGVGIVDTDISDYMAMKLGSDGEHVIQVDKRLVEQIGIIKFDILGVQTLKMVQEIQNDLHLSEYDININNPKFENDRSPFELLSKALTNGVFQVESAGMKDLLLRLQATNMEDLSAVLALYRPDSMGALEEFIKCKHDPSLVTYIHPDMKPILESTYGCMIYQEQLLDIVRTFGGRSYGGADLFRKAIGKKNIELVKQESEKLYQEIIDNGYSHEIAKTISEELKTKGGYLFNKSHSYSYAVLCFQTAYLKINYPVYFFKALFNLNKDKAGMVNKYIVDSKQFGVTVLPPHINKSQVDFSIYDNNVLFGFSAITGIGERIAQEIVADREKNGKYKNLQDLLSRTTLAKTQIINLMKSGAIPTKDKKSCLLKYLKSLYKPLEYKELSKLPTYNKLIIDYDIDIEKYRIGNGKYDYDKDLLLTLANQKKKEKFDLQQEDRLKQFLSTNNKYLENADFWEFEALQIFIHNNPFEEALPYLTTAFEAVENDNDCVIVGVISRVQKKKDRNKKPFAFVNIYSTFGIIEGVLWNSQLVQYEDLVKKGSQVAIKCRKTDEDKVTIQAMRPYVEWLSERKKRYGRKNI